MVSKIYKEIENDIDNTCLTIENKQMLHKIHKMLYKYKNKSEIELPILVLTKNLDNIDISYIENLILKMLENYKVFGGKIKNTFKSIGSSPNRLITSIESGEAYQVPLDNFSLDLIYTHSLYPKIDYIFSNNNTSQEISDMLIARYEHNKISTKIDIKELEPIVKNNLEAKVYGTDEMCLQYMFIKSIKSYISSNRRNLEIKDIPVIEKAEEVIEKLDTEETKQENIFSKLTGLEYIKDELDKMIKFAIFNKELRKENSDIPKENLNMCFFGSPGTGKTTVARLVANEFYKNNLIEKNEVTEILPNDLIGEYVGHTKNAVRTVLEKAKGGILFIDEAYQIASTGYKAGNPFMNEALTELLKYMENPDNIVIFAGYQDELEEMINMNPRDKIKNSNEIKLSRLYCN